MISSEGDLYFSGRENLRISFAEFNRLFCDPNRLVGIF